MKFFLYNKIAAVKNFFEPSEKSYTLSHIHSFIHFFRGERAN